MNTKAAKARPFSLRLAMMLFGSIGKIFAISTMSCCVNIREVMVGMGPVAPGAISGTEHGSACATNFGTEVVE
jgi:hypothetical protein